MFFLNYTLCIEPDPVENFAVVSSSETTLSFFWSPPITAAHLTTGYRLTCSPLLDGIPTPDPLLIAPTATTATVTGLLSGVTYICDIITLTSWGASQPRTLTSSTVETGQCGPNSCSVYCVYSYIECVLFSICTCMWLCAHSPSRCSRDVCGSYWRETSELLLVPSTCGSA